MIVGNINYVFIDVEFLLIGGGYKIRKMIIDIGFYKNWFTTYYLSLSYL